MKKRILFPAILLAIISLMLVWYYFFVEVENTIITVSPARGRFNSTVTTTGEMQAENSIDIRGPGNVRQARIWQMKISKLVPEGTVVKEGEFVAELDKSEIAEKVNDLQLSLEKTESQYLQSSLDSALTLSNARDELENIKYAMEEKQLIMEQSSFEAPAIIRQAEIDYEREKRNFNQKTKNYKTKVAQAIAKLQEIGTELSKHKSRLAIYLKTMAEFTILAPANGMVIYRKEWNGKKITEGSTIGAWDPVVATLPDLTSMKSVTYVNEVDIQKIKVGQTVDIGLDADPDKKLTGEVIQVANIGEQLKNSDSKVFEVTIKVNEKDTTLLPSMTTSNKILAATVQDAIYIPLECVHSEIIKQKDKETKVTYVFKIVASDVIKQEVELGLMNENEVVVVKGISTEDELMLTIPVDAADIEISYLNEDKES